MADYVWKVYKIKSPCGRAYIGITRTTLAKRWKAHTQAAKKTRIPFYDAILEYGNEAFSIEILTECFSEWEARKCERAMIALHDTYFKGDKGFNRSIGGNGNTGGASEETKAKISAATKRRFEQNPESKYDFINRYNSMGRPVSEEGRLRKLEGLKSAHTPEVWERGAAKRRGVKQSEDRSRKSAEAAAKGRAVYKRMLWCEKEYENALASRVDRAGLKKYLRITPEERQRRREWGKVLAAMPRTPEQNKKRGRKGPTTPEHVEKLKANMAVARSHITPEVTAKMTETRRAQMADPAFRAHQKHLWWCDDQYKKALAARIGRPRKHRLTRTKLDSTEKIETAVDHG